ncbi:hypothetical protein AURDEDRAFT_166582 [Auricularia subglabra TFB-10046 SS5]|nr:hypothetical protein AURDEDRAFT_166582 [Auricularia subglabra TFB-10046 SS5]
MASEGLVVTATVVATARTVGAVEVVAATLFFYDYLTTLADEIELIWRSKWGAGKILFLLARYLVLPQLFLTMYSALFTPAHLDCRSADIFAIWSLLLGVTAAKGILTIRTWAIWSTGRSILVILGTALCATTVLSFYLAVEFIRGMHLYPMAHPDLRAGQLVAYHICPLKASNSGIGVFWITVAAFELLVFVMTAIRGIGYWRQRTSCLVRSLYRDGFLYFVYLFSISTANVIIIYGSGSRDHPAYVLLLGMLQCSLHSILSCRLVLHIRSSAERERRVHLPLSDLSVSQAVGEAA